MKPLTSAPSPTTGRSNRTPVKHALMCSAVGSEFAAWTTTRSMGRISRALWLDLTAGDGTTDLRSRTAPDRLWDDSQDDFEHWKLNCSPGIFAYYGSCWAQRRPPRPLDIVLYEQKANTYRLLLSNLASPLKRLGYIETAEDRWTHRDGAVGLRIINADGATARIDDVDDTTAVFVSNDPNAITDWAMRPTFRTELRARTSWCRTLSSMGCNPHGLKRLPRKDREGWYLHVQRQIDALPHNHDLRLIKIDGDDAQWAYLLDDACAWGRKVDDAITRAFSPRWGYTHRGAWLRSDPAGFAAICDELFLTRRERNDVR